MKLIPTKAAGFVVRHTLPLKANSPAIMLGAGITAMVASTVLACQATLKVDEKLAYVEDKKNEINYAEETGKNEAGQDYTPKDAESDRRMLRVQTAGQFARLYAPAVGVGLVGIALVTSGHIVLTKRNIALGAAYTALDRAYQEYRSRVKDRYGEEAEREIRYGVVEKEIVEEGEHGHEVKIVKQHSGVAASPYAKLFDEYNTNWRPGPDYNKLFVKSQQQWANDRLRLNGHLFLNEVYDMLGIERTQAGAAVGWVKGHGDDYVDFGLSKDDPITWEFMYGNGKAIMLDFNVAGPIHHLIGKKF